MEKMESSRNFANKLWNATRFVIRSLETGGGQGGFSLLPSYSTFAVEDRWILSRLNRIIGEVTKLMEEYQFGEAQRQIHDFLWGEYCDWYIEMAKIRLQANDNSPLPVLVHVLEKALKLLHPFMPFITEELWQNLKKQAKWITVESIMVASYPEVDESLIDPAAEEEIGVVVEIVRVIRNVRAEHKVDTTRWIAVKIYTDASIHTVVSRYTGAVKTLARANPVDFRKGDPVEKADARTLVLPLAAATVVIPMSSMVDMEAEKKKIEKEITQTRAEADRLEGRLKDESFLTKAPPAVIEKERQKLYTLKEKLEKLNKQNTGL
jgi:valyl-tRNA synthetase